MNKVALITGGSSGIGLAAAEALKKEGYRVYEFSRHGGAEAAVHITADVSDEASVIRGVQALLEQEKRLDLVVNCAGFGISGAAEFTPAVDAKRLFDTDFFGMVHVNRAVIPVMREAGGGRIIQISSVAAAAPIPFQTFYSCAKAAVNAYTCALANELRPFRISVCAVMPGDIHTGFTAAREKQHTGDELYEGRIGRSVSIMERDEKNGMSPDRIGRLLARIARKKRVKPLYTAGFFYQCAVLLTRLLPCRLVNWILWKMYAV